MSAEAAGWADPLTRRERADLAKLLARACGRSWRGAERMRVNGHSITAGKLGSALVATSIEMSALHLDVTERAAVPARGGGLP